MTERPAWLPSGQRLSVGKRGLLKIASPAVPPQPQEGLRAITFEPPRAVISRVSRPARPARVPIKLPSAQASAAVPARRDTDIVALRFLALRVSAALSGEPAVTLCTAFLASARRSAVRASPAPDAPPILAAPCLTPSPRHTEIDTPTVQVTTLTPQT